VNEKEFIETAIKTHAGAWFESPYCKIFGKDRSKGVFTPKQNYLQHKIQMVIDKMEDLGLPVRIIGLKPRQKGSTTYFAATVYHTLRRRSTSAILIGGQLSQVAEAWGMMQTYSKHDRIDWKNTGDINTKEGRWSHGSKLIGETAKDVLAGVGGTHQVVHAFEVARWGEHGVANTAEVLANILKSVPLLPDTVVILESTAESAAGEFPTRYFGATSAEEFLSGEVDVKPGTYVRVFAPWFEFEDSSLRLTEEEQQQIQETLDDDEEYAGEKELIENYLTEEDGVKHLGTAVRNFTVWEQLAWRRYAIRQECKRDKNIFDRDYPKDERTAFQKSGNMRFNYTGINVIRKRAEKITPLHGIIEEANKRFAFRQLSANEAKITIFEKPIPGRRYIVPVDPMTGASQTSGEDPDYHSAWALRAGFWNNSGQWIRPCTAARVVQCRWDIDVLEDSIWKLARYYGPPGTNAKIVIEMNQDKGLTELLKLRNANLYQREIFNKMEFKTTKALGYVTNVRTRENLIETLATAIREWDKPGDGIDIYCPKAIEQLENFVRKSNGRSEAAEGNHDDDVFGIALGYELIEQATIYLPERSIFGPPPLSENRQPTGSPYS
jgi:hypothetical protein